MEPEDYDVIIIGSGPGGGTMAWRLAQTGKRVLLLERGDYLPRERENWDTQAVFVDARYQSKETWYGADGREFHPGLHYFVGGNSKVYGSVLLRLRERDFDEIQHADGISPAWPLKCDDFEPYYQAAEELYCVHGLRGEDPTEPPSNRPYAYPPVSHEPRIQKLFDDLNRVGHHPFHLPVGILLDEVNGKPTPHSACIRCNAFDGYPCLTNGKADSQVICVDPALQKHANLTLRTGSYVEKLSTDTTGQRISGVEVIQDVLTQSNLEAHERLKRKLQELCKELDLHPHLFDRSLYLGQNVPIGGTAHQAGTLRFGTDPSESVLDSTRDRQFICNRCELLPVHRCSESYADNHRECLAGCRSHHRTPRVNIDPAAME